MYVVRPKECTTWKKNLPFLPLLLKSDSIKKRALVFELKQSIFYYPAGFFWAGYCLLSLGILKCLAFFRAPSTKTDPTGPTSV